MLVGALAEVVGAHGDEEVGVEALLRFVGVVVGELVAEGVLGGDEVVGVELRDAAAGERFEAIAEREVLARQDLAVGVDGGGPVLGLRLHEAEAVPGVDGVIGVGVLDGDAAVALGGGGEIALGLERQAGVVQRRDDVARVGRTRCTTRSNSVERGVEVLVAVRGAGALEQRRGVDGLDGAVGMGREDHRLHRDVLLLGRRLRFCVCAQPPASATRMATTSRFMPA